MKAYLLLSTILVLMLSYMVLLSPPMAGVRSFLGIKEPVKRRFNPELGAAEVDAPPEFLARVTFVYHSIFAVLLAMTALPVAERQAKSLTLGAILTAAGGMGYSYLGGFEWHGLFILGLATLFTSGLTFLTEFRPKDLVDWNIALTTLLLLIGGVIGGWLGSSFMWHRQEFVEALRAARFNPDLVEENAFWRALTAHEHAMISLALTLAFLVAAKVMGYRGKRALYLVGIGQLVTAVASFLVWPVGKVAHLIITPAALLLIAATTLASLNFSRSRWEFLAMNLIIWASVAVPGALVAMSLRKPLIFNPPFRDEAWDWAELAYNVGHWHILLGLWGVAVLVTALAWFEARRLGGWLSIAGMFVASLGANLYALASGPGKYSPNPYNNQWLPILEAGLIILALGTATGYFSLLETFIRRYRPFPGSTHPPQRAPLGSPAQEVESS